MLTGDLVQARVNKGCVLPFYIDVEDEEHRALASQLIDIFKRNAGRTRRALQDDLDDHLGSGTQYMLHRGLAKLLSDRCEFESRDDVDPIDLRRDVFTTAAQRYREGGRLSRVVQDTFALLQDERSWSADFITSGLYADLKEEQHLTSMKGTTPDRLLHRYNAALAQAVILKATKLEIRIQNQSALRYRELFRNIKFFQLMHSVEGTGNDGYFIRLDGPLSLFRQSQRYGLQMANFLPSLLAMDDWKLEAEVVWGKKRDTMRFALNSEEGLESHKSLRGQYRPEEISWLVERFEKLESGWSISTDAELIDLEGRGVFAPDFTFQHAASGTRAHLEIFGYWRRGGVEARAKLLAQHGPAHCILALSNQLRTEAEVLSDLPEILVYEYKHQPIARDVLKILQSIEGAER